MLMTVRALCREVRGTAVRSLLSSLDGYAASALADLFGVVAENVIRTVR